MMLAVSGPPPGEVPTPFWSNCGLLRFWLLVSAARRNPFTFPNSFRFPNMKALAKNPDTLVFVFFTALFATVIAHVGR